VSDQFTDRFTRDIAQHEMQVIRDDGVNRHLRFKRPGTMCMHFDLLTWPGYLCYTGDMGTFVFRRLHDMFQFFRCDMKRGIDYRYWAEKCEAADKHEGLTEYSFGRFERVIRDRFESFLEDEGRQLSKDEAAELWGEIQSDVLDAGEDDERAAFTAAGTFEWSDRLVFPDFWEANLHEYTHRFQWCCHALRWAIATYDAQKTGLASVAAADQRA
jgi:hypothetical protein